MLRILLAIAAMSCLPDASAGVLYKCVGPKGQVAVQSDPCPTGHKTQWVKGYTPDRAPARAPVYSQPQQQSEHHTYESPPQPSARDQQRAACRSARDWEATQRRRNPNMTYDQLTALHDRTAEACRGL